MFHTVGYVTDDVIAAQFQALHQVVDGNSLSLGGIIQVDTPPILLFKFDYNLTAQLKQTNFIKLGKKKYKKKIKNPLQNYES
jgi:predicted proteasome-type protease